MTVSPIANPPTLDSFSNEELSQRVTLFLASCRPELGEVDVLANDGVVYLRGMLPTYFRRQLAVERARHVAGVRLLIDQIAIPEHPGENNRLPR
jgi:hypothetical protein